MRARLGPRVALMSIARDSASREHAQRVAAREGREVVVAPAAVCQRGEEPRVARDVLEPLGQRGDAVVVAAEPDVLDARHLAHVLAVPHHVVEGGGGLGVLPTALR